jgi:hypothetical protein
MDVLLCSVAGLKSGVLMIILTPRTLGLAIELAATMTLVIA